MEETEFGCSRVVYLFDLLPDPQRCWVRPCLVEKLTEILVFGLRSKNARYFKRFTGPPFELFESLFDEVKSDIIILLMFSTSKCKL